jgi:hypothetical protein
MASSKVYQYTTLPDPKSHIRLLVLDGENSQSLETYNISEVPDYEAVSYTWGTQQPISTLAVDGNSLAVTPHLLEGIWKLRPHATHFTKKQLRLWIDAICINQKDDVGKAAQIPLMGSIYSNAERVLVWLGPAADGSDRVLSEMDTLERKLRKWGTLLRSDQVTLAGLPPLSDSIWAFVAKFWSRPWFRRLWIVQEAVLAKDILIVCGTDTVRFEKLFVFVDICIDTLIAPLVFDTEGSGLAIKGATLLWTLGWARKTGTQDFPFLELLRMGRSSEAKEPVGSRSFGFDANRPSQFHRCWIYPKGS